MIKQIIILTCFITCSIAIPIAIYEISNNNKVLLNSILLLLMLPGYINAIKYVILDDSL